MQSKSCQVIRAGLEMETPFFWQQHQGNTFQTKAKFIWKFQMSWSNTESRPKCNQRNWVLDCQGKWKQQSG